MHHRRFFLLWWLFTRKWNFSLLRHLSTKTRYRSLVIFAKYTAFNFKITFSCFYIQKRRARVVYLSDLRSHPSPKYNEKFVHKIIAHIKYRYYRLGELCGTHKIIIYFRLNIMPHKRINRVSTQKWITRGKNRGSLVFCIIILRKKSFAFG